MNVLILDWHIIHCMQNNHELDKLLQKDRAIFLGEVDKLEGVNVKLHVDTKLIYVRICEASTCPTEKVEAVLDKLEAQSVIEKIKFLTGKHLLYVSIVKQDGIIRICGDYKLTVNKIIKIDAYPLPKIDELFVTLTGGRTFSKLDLLQVYQQLVLDEASKPYTIISRHKGLIYTGTIVRHLVCWLLLPSFSEP